MVIICINIFNIYIYIYIYILFYGPTLIKKLGLRERNSTSTPETHESRVDKADDQLVDCHVSLFS